MCWTILTGVVVITKVHQLPPPVVKPLMKGRNEVIFDLEVGR